MNTLDRVWDQSRAAQGRTPPKATHAHLMVGESSGLPSSESRRALAVRTSCPLTWTSLPSCFLPSYLGLGGEQRKQMQVRGEEMWGDRERGTERGREGQPQRENQTPSSSQDLSWVNRTTKTCL